MRLHTSGNGQIERGVYVGLSSIGRLAAAFLVGALLFLAFAFLNADPAGWRFPLGLFALVAAPGLWVLALNSTRGLHIPWTLQTAAMVLGGLISGGLFLLITLSALADD